jgi:hypothetical protein
MNSQVQASELQPRPLTDAESCSAPEHRLWSRPESPGKATRYTAGAQRARNGRTAGGSDRPVWESSMWIVTA